MTKFWGLLLGAFVSLALWALVFVAIAEAWGAPITEYIDGNTLCVVVDPVSQQATIVRSGQGTRVVSYQWDGSRFVFAAKVPSYAHELAARDGLNLKRKCG